MSDTFELDGIIVGDTNVSHIRGRMDMVGDDINGQLLTLFNDVGLKLFEGEGIDGFALDDKPMKIQGLLADYGDKVLTMFVVRGNAGNDLFVVLENDTVKGNYLGTAMELAPHLNGENIQALILAVYGCYIKEFDYSSQIDVIATLR